MSAAAARLCGEPVVCYLADRPLPRLSIGRRCRVVLGTSVSSSTALVDGEIGRTWCSSRRGKAGRPKRKKKRNGALFDNDK